MKKQITLSLAIVMMMSTAAFATGPAKEAAKANDRETNQRTGARPPTSATANSREATEHQQRVETLAKRAKIEPSRLLAGTEKHADVEILVKKDPNDKRENPELVKQVVRIEGKALFEKLSAKLESSDVDKNAIQLGLHLISQMANFSSGARRAEDGVAPKSAQDIAKDTREFFKFASDYVDVVTRSPESFKSTSEQRAEIDSYVELATGFKAYAKKNPGAKVDEIYANGISEEARARQRGCQQG